jgi:hypothetical protein
MNKIITGFFSLLLLAIATRGDAAVTSEDEEILIALSAAPEHLRAAAGVYVLRPTGFVRVRESRNGFNCLINRELPDSFEPECFDAEGSATLVPIILYQTKLRSQHRSAEEIARAVGLGFSSGRFRAPGHTGICYMLSTRNVVVMDRKTGRVGAVGPHLMFYAPYSLNTEFGATPDLKAHFLIADEGTPFAMAIVPVSDTEPNVHAAH